MLSVADPGFPEGGRGPPMWALFGENVCENERIGPPLDPPMVMTTILGNLSCHLIYFA